MTPRAEHTPTPWDFACDSYGKVRHSRKACVYASPDDNLHTVAARIENWEDARLIVRAVNAHADLVAALEAILTAVETDSVMDAMAVVRQQARAALARAKGSREATPMGEGK